jgi:superfamily I DNA/RNA helicase
VIKLEQNYRSTGNILAAANAVIRKNLKRKEKALWTSGKSGAPIDYILCRDDEDEARQVIERLQAACFRGRRLRDFAILYRTNVQSRIFEEQLRYENIPYVLIGGQQFFDRKEVKDVIAYLKVIARSPNRPPAPTLRSSRSSCSLSSAATPWSASATPSASPRPATTPARSRATTSHRPKPNLPTARRTSSARRHRPARPSARSN